MDIDYFSVTTNFAKLKKIRKFAALLKTIHNFNYHDFDNNSHI